MQMVYNSDNYVVVEVDVPADLGTPARGGYEIVDKFARKDIFIGGLVAESFKAGVQALIDDDRPPDAFDDFIEGYATLAQQPLAMH